MNPQLLILVLAPSSGGQQDWPRPSPAWTSPLLSNPLPFMGSRVLANPKLSLQR